MALHLLVNILSLGTKPLYDRHAKFHNIISEFRTKLAHPENQQKTILADIDALYGKLDDANYRFIFFKNYYQKYIDNLHRLKPEPDDKDFDWSLLQIALAENKWKPTKPFPIWAHHIKYQYALTSKPFIAYQKKQNRKKLNKPTKTIKEPVQPKPEKEWMRVPLPKTKTKV